MRGIDETTRLQLALNSTTGVLGANLSTETGDAELIWQVDSRGMICQAGDAVRSLLGYGEDLLGTPLAELAHPDDRTPLLASIAQGFGHTDRATMIDFRVRGSGDRWLALEGTLVHSEKPAGPCLVFNVRDVTERKRREARIRRKVRWFHSLTRYSDVAILVFDADSTVTFVSGSTEAILGRPADEMSWNAFVGSIHESDREQVLARVSAALKQPGEAITAEYRLCQPSGRVIYAESRFVNGVMDHDLRGFVCYTRDITERKIRDPVTGLVNRTYLDERLRLLIDNRPASAPPFALILMEIDDFVALVGSLGEQHGSTLLSELGGRLERAVGPRGTLARIEHDQFAVLCESLPNREGVTELADILHLNTYAPIDCGGRDVHVTVSMGITVGDRRRHGTPEAVLTAARAALRAARQSGRSRSALYETRMAQHLMARFGLENDLHDAVRRNEFEVHYQPLVSLQSTRVVGFEALVRWKHPERGYVSPGLFIPIAEETGLILEIGATVLREACRQLGEWQATVPGGASLAMAVNLSPAQLADDALAARVTQAVQLAGVEPDHVRLELTESALVENPEAVAEVLGRLRARGFRLALDDFGTGYSSLSYLHRFPFDTLKIDRSFVTRLEGPDSRRAILVGAIVDMARALGLRVVAEGVETAEQMELLRALRCDLGQGFLFSRAVPADQATAYLLARAEEAAAPSPAPSSPEPEPERPDRPTRKDHRFSRPPSRTGSKRMGSGPKRLPEE